MEPNEKRKFIFSLLFPLGFILIGWLVKLIEVHFELDFVKWGILPRSIEGLKGILFSAFIHGDWNHLINNSIPFLILGSSLFYFYRPIAFPLLLWSYLLSGLYTWISARHAFHIGASGVVYALFGFIFISGFLRKHTQLMAISFLAAFLYGSLIWGILPWDKSISWEGHFWGLFVGLILAVYFRKKGPQRKVYHWPDEEEQDDELAEWKKAAEKAQKDPQLKVEYHFVPKKEKD